MSSEDLRVSETFYSLQGEGPFTGTPAVFLRLSGCNLRCLGFSYKDPMTGQHLGCDTRLVWEKSKRQPIDDLLALWSASGWLDKIKKGAHVIITGGEPLLQETCLLSFIHRLRQRLGSPVFFEIETNGTLMPSKAFIEAVDHFNVSPKLRHSGESREKAHHLDVLSALLASNKAIYKFVISQPNDFKEVIADYIAPLGLPRALIWLMPEGGTQAAIDSKKQWLAQLCIDESVRFTTRLHIDLWDQATGV